MEEEQSVITENDKNNELTNFPTNHNPDNDVKINGKSVPPNKDSPGDSNLSNGTTENGHSISDINTATDNHNDIANGVEGSEVLDDDMLLSEIDQMASDNSEELSSLKQEVIRLEAANKHLEEQVKQLFQQKENEIQSHKQSRSESESQNQALQKTVASQFGEIKMWKERVETNDKAARKAIEGYKVEHQANIDKITKKFQECKSEKEAMVVRYAQGETKIAQLQANVSKLEVKVKDKEREKDVLAEKLRNVKSESAKSSSSLGEKSSELLALRKEVEGHKEAISSHEYRTKWAQNKLKSELDAHKETKVKLEEMSRRYSETKEECVTIRNNCQDMIKTYQDSEDIKSNSLDIEVKKKDGELQAKAAKISELMQEIEAMKGKLSDTLKEVNILRKQSSAGEVKVEELEKMNAAKIKELEDSNGCIKSLREENSSIRNKLQEMQSLQQDLESKQYECSDLQSQLSAMNQTSDEYLMEMESCKTRDEEMLLLTQKMTERNAELQSENTSLKSKLTGIGVTSGEQEEHLSRLEQSLKQQEHLHSREKSSALEQLEKLNAKNEELSQTIGKLNSDIEGYQTAIKTLKKKQTSSVKELTREVHTLKRQLEAHESKHIDDTLPLPGRQSSPARGASAPVSLQHSRTNSNSSLDKSEGWVVINHQRHGSPEQSRQLSPPDMPTVGAAPVVSAVMGSARYGVRFRPPPPLPAPSDSLEPQFLEPDKQKMVEKIVKLQKINARKNEKLDFCQDHIHQLVEEVQKKTRIIQMYALKDQTGALSSDSMDLNKSAIAKKGGIMASISNQQSKDDTMNLKLSLKINNKLQALLEDTLLKNITLKENMETLGQEIDRISQENVTLNAHLQTFQTPDS